MNERTAYPLALRDIKGAKDYKDFDSSKPFKRYYHVQKYAKSQYVPYRSIALAIANATYNVAPDCVTMMYATTANIPAGTNVGDVTLTWYVRAWGRTRG